jgi:hypothetical protein
VERWGASAINRETPGFGSARQVKPQRGDGKCNEWLPFHIRKAIIVLLAFAIGVELTVGFHTHHRHFTNHEDRMERRHITDGLNYASAIIEERVGVQSFYRNGQFIGSQSIELPPPVRTRNWDGHESFGLWGKLSKFLHPWDRWTLRSWSGRLDRDEARGS